MILLDVNGEYIFPGQIHNIAVVPSAQTPRTYTIGTYNTDGESYALVVEGREYDGEEGRYNETRHVIGWFNNRHRAEAAKHNLICSMGIKYQEYRNDAVFSNLYGKGAE